MTENNPLPKEQNVQATMVAAWVFFERHQTSSQFEWLETAEKAWVPVATFNRHSINS
jgi:hypothetical protein